jgi:hypothetical protein
MNDEKIFDLFCEKLGIIGTQKEILMSFKELQEKNQEKEETRENPRMCEDNSRGANTSELYFDEFIRENIGKEYMITRVKGTKHGYDISNATNEEFQDLCKNYPEKLRCLICNSNMRKNFRIGLLGSDIITINNRVHDGVVFINHFF